VATESYSADVQVDAEGDAEPVIGSCTAGRGTERAHSFQVQVINLPMSRASRSDSSATMMFCTTCGMAFLMGTDMRWHRVQMGELASQAFQPRHRSYPPAPANSSARPSAPRFPWSAEGDDS
jgi:hypothetical protein